MGVFFFFSYRRSPARRLILGIPSFRLVSTSIFSRRSGLTYVYCIIFSTPVSRGTKALILHGSCARWACGGNHQGLLIFLPPRETVVRFVFKIRTFECLKDGNRMRMFSNVNSPVAAIICGGNVNTRN